MIIPTVNENSEQDWNVGLVRHMHFQFRLVDVYFQAHIIHNLGHRCILGRPFAKLIKGCLDTLDSKEMLATPGLKITAHPLEVMRAIKNLIE